MTPITKNERIEELIRDIEETSEQVHQLLSELNESKIDLAILKTELKTIVESVKELSQIIRNENHDGLSISARIALIEQSIKAIWHVVGEYKEVSTEVAVLEEKITVINKIIEMYGNREQNINSAKILGKWQLYVSSMTGVLALIGVVLSYILQHC